MDSSNYDPSVMWPTGAQLVALNYQTPDLPMRINRGKFRENGQCGYVLKPDFLRTYPPTPRAPAVRLTLQIISGYQLPKPHGAKKGEIIDPFVHVTISGVAKDEHKWKTKTVQDNGFNPQWEEVFR